LSKPSKGDIVRSLEKIMGTKVKPVQPTEIKDKKIVKEIIAQIRKPIPRLVEKKLEKEDELIMKFFK
jgi:serine/threonine-protein kinase RIO1